MENTRLLSIIRSSEGSLLAHLVLEYFDFWWATLLQHILSHLQLSVFQVVWTLVTLFSKLSVMWWVLWCFKFYVL
jgi:hypothetical protein